MQATVYTNGRGIRVGDILLNTRKLNPLGTVVEVKATGNIIRIRTQNPLKDLSIDADDCVYVSRWTA